MYTVGIDIGTTYTAAAVWRDGRAEIVSLGSHAAAIPSVVFLRSDGSFLTGEGASRRGLSEPNRIAREFKRRLGDTTTILLGGGPYSAAALTARLLRSVLDTVFSREGGPPASICVSHPANWGPYKMDLLRQVVRLADVDQPVEFTTDPQAAASYLAHQQPLGPSAVVAVYDLGGGTFDAAALRRTPDGFDLIGRPEGIERLGGLDFDATILAHVAASVGSALEQLDKDDPAAISASARLRDECVQAKEALSADTDAAIQVLLPGVSTEVGLTRSELEAMVRPGVHDSVEALRRAIRSAGYTPQGLDAVLLVGGSSRMPIVAQMVGSELGRTVEVDANPKLAVALGAAWQASRAIAGNRPTPSTPSTPSMPSTSPLLSTPSTPSTSERAAPPDAADVEEAAKPSVRAAALTPAAGDRPADPVPWPEEPTGEIPVVAGLVQPSEPGGLPAVGSAASGLPAVGSAASGSPAVGPSVMGPSAVGSSVVGSPALGSGAAGAAGGAIPRAPLPKARVTARAAVGSAADAGSAVPAPAPAPELPARAATRRLPVLVGATAVLLLAAGGTAWALARPDGRHGAAPTAAGKQQGKVTAGASSRQSPAGSVPADEQCTDEMKKSTRWVCLTKATLHDGTFTLWYDAEWDGTPPDIQKGFHLHIYGGDGTDPDESTMGSQAVKHSKYYFEDQQPSVRRTTDADFEAVGDAKKVCARIAHSGHGLEKAYDGSYHTGNCIPIQRY